MLPCGNPWEYNTTKMAPRQFEFPQNFCRKLSCVTETISDAVPIIESERPLLGPRYFAPWRFLSLTLHDLPSDWALFLPDFHKFGGGFIKFRAYKIRK